MLYIMKSQSNEAICREGDLMEEFIRINLDAEKIYMKVYVNDLYLQDFYTLGRSSASNFLNQFLVKGKNIIEISIVPSEKNDDVSKENFDIQIDVEKKTGEIITTLLKEKIEIGDLELDDDNSFKYRHEFEYDGFDLKPWLVKLQPFTDEEALKFTRHVIDVVIKKDLNAFMNLKKYTTEILSTAFSVPDYKRELLDIVKECLINGELEKTEIKDHEFVFNSCLDNKVYHVYVEPDKTLDINKGIEKYDFRPRDLLLFRRINGQGGMLSLAFSIAKINGEFASFI